jgi:hypothetical protein
VLTTKTTTEEMTMTITIETITQVRQGLFDEDGVLVGKGPLVRRVTGKLGAKLWWTDHDGISSEVPRWGVDGNPSGPLVYEEDYKGSKEEAWAIESAICDAADAAVRK